MFISIVKEVIYKCSERQALTSAFCAIPRDIFIKNGRFNEYYYYNNQTDSIQIIKRLHNKLCGTVMFLYAVIIFSGFDNTYEPYTLPSGYT